MFIFKTFFLWICVFSFESSKFDNIHSYTDKYDRTMKLHKLHLKIFRFKNNTENNISSPASPRSLVFQNSMENNMASLTSLGNLSF